MSGKTCLTHKRISLVLDHFLSAADEDYVVARMSALSGIWSQSLWSAAQAVEKYCKAILCLNEISTQKDGHDLESLAEKVKALAPELWKERFQFPENFPKGPDAYQLNDANTDAETVSEFIQRLNSLGSPNQRYRQTKSTGSHIFLFKLDQTCLRLRRLCVPLDQDLPTDRSQTFRGFLKSNTSENLGKIIAKLAIPTFKNDLLNAMFRRGNVCFFPDENLGKEWTFSHAEPAWRVNVWTSETPNEDYEWFRGLAKVDPDLKTDWQTEIDKRRKMGK